MRWMLSWSMMRSVIRCSLGKDLLMAGGTAEELPVSLSFPALWQTHPPPFSVCWLFVSCQKHLPTASGWLEARTIEPLWCNPSFSCFGDLKILHSHPLEVHPLYIRLLNFTFVYTAIRWMFAACNWCIGSSLSLMRMLCMASKAGEGRSWALKGAAGVVLLYVRPACGEGGNA